MIPNIYRTCEEDLGGGYTVAPSISDWANPSSTRWRNSACLPRASKLSEGGHRVCFKAGLVCSVRQPTERACLQSPSVQLAYGRALRALAIDNRSLEKPSCVFARGPLRRLDERVQFIRLSLMGREPSLRQTL